LGVRKEGEAAGAAGNDPDQESIGEEGGIGFWNQIGGGINPCLQVKIK